MLAGILAGFVVSAPTADAAAEVERRNGAHVVGLDYEEEACIAGAMLALRSRVVELQSREMW